MAMPSLPDDLQQVLTQIDQADLAADTLVTPLSDAQFHWQPDQGRAWSVALCIEHLATANRVYAEPMRAAMDAARARNLKRSGPIKSTVFGRMFAASMEPPVRRKMKAPAKILPPANGTREEILQRYHQAHASIRQMIIESAEIDANRATFTNPFIKVVRVRVGTAFHIIAAHDRRHLWQAERVLEARGFPPSAKATGGRPRVY
jgi:hypothetical protein